MPTCDDLATKLELQELRDQLNSWLGEKESGGNQKIFVAGAGGIISAGLVADTALQATKTRAKNALTDIAVDSVSEAPIWKQLKDGTAKWTGTRGNGAKESIKGLTNVSKTIGAGAEAATAATAVAAKNMAAMSILANLAAIAASIGINIATVKVFDARIEAEAKSTTAAIDATNNSMLRLYEKNQGDISAVNSELSNHRSAIDSANSNISAIKQETQIARTQIGDLQGKLASTQLDVISLQSELQESNAQIEQLDAEYGQAIDGLKATIAGTQSSLDRALETMADHGSQLAKTEERIIILEDTADLLSQQYSQLAKEFTQLQEDFDTLQTDIDEDNELQDVKSKSMQARLVILENKEREKKAGSGSWAAARGAAQSQSALLSLLASLTGSPDSTPDITSDDFLNDSSKFDRTFRELLPNVGTVNEKQLEDFRLRLNEDFTKNFNDGLDFRVIPALSTIKNQTTERKMADATKIGVCESLNDGGCNPTPGNPNPTDGLKGMNQAMQNKADALLAAMGIADLAQGQTILSVVKDTNGVVRHAKYGLEAVQNGLTAMQNFADTAWKATHADKVLNAVNTALLVHNAMMLSNNLAQTIGEAVNVALDAVGITNSDGTAINVGGLVRSKLNAVLVKILGASNYKALTLRLAKANRIYQSSARLLDATRDLFDSARSTAESTAQNTGKIGNALLESGVVLEDSYETMVDKYRPQSKALRMLDGLQAVEDKVSSISQIASDVVDTQESFDELKQAKSDWVKENEDLVKDKNEKKEETKIDSQVRAEIEAKGFAKDDTED